MKWLLILTCLCGEPRQSIFSTRDACEQSARWELYDRNINVPSYRCEEIR